MFDTVRREAGAPDSIFAGRVTRAGEWMLDFGATEEFLDRASKANQPACVLGTAFSFVHLLDHVQHRSKHLRLPTGSVVMETGGYKGKSRVIPRSELHKWMCDRLGISFQQIVCEYGMSELSSQAYARVSAEGWQTADQTALVFHFPAWARCQVISAETGREVKEGETGLIRVFDLANVYSVMAIQTEDLGVRRGDGFELLGRSTLAEPRGCSLMSAS